MNLGIIKKEKKISPINCAAFTHTVPSQDNLYDDYKHFYMTEMAI